LIGWKINLTILTNKIYYEKAIGRFGSLIILTSMGLAWYFYDGVLSLIIFLALFGNNLENRDRNYVENKM